MTYRYSQADETLDDDAYLDAWERGYPFDDAHHVAHLRLAWILVRRLPFEEAVARMGALLAPVAGQAEERFGRNPFDPALTRAWMRRVADGRPADRFLVFLALNPELMEHV